MLADRPLPDGGELALAAFAPADRIRWRIGTLRYAHVFDDVWIDIVYAAHGGSTLAHFASALTPVGSRATPTGQLLEFRACDAGTKAVLEVSA